MQIQNLHYLVCTVLPYILGLLLHKVMQEGFAGMTSKGPIKSSEPLVGPDIAPSWNYGRTRVH